MKRFLFPLLLGILWIALSTPGTAQERKTVVSIQGSRFLINGEPTYQGVVWKNPEGRAIPMEGLLMKLPDGAGHLR
jgi:hypothetical protein